MPAEGAARAGEAVHDEECHDAGKITFASGKKKETLEAGLRIGVRFLAAVAAASLLIMRC